MSETVLVTGGAGYIGSHAVLELLNADYKVIVVDNFINSVQESLNRVKKLSGGKDFTFYETDITDRPGLKKIFSENKIDSVIHFAGLKAVGESSEIPLKYYDNNINGSVILFQEMEAAGVRKLVFSSSATVYGEPESVPIKETAKLGVLTNPYGRSKYMIEEIIKDVQKAHDWDVVLLRYFNPVGAHESGDIGESPDFPNNLLPFITQVAIGRRAELGIFGDDYKTQDGTGVRDYIHVVDLVLGHLKALEKLNKDKGLFLYNLGTGNGVSVLEMLESMRRISGKEIPAVVKPRRPGDVGEVVADSSLAEKELGWKAKYGLEEMVTSAWNWQSKNPNGYLQ